MHDMVYVSVVVIIIWGTRALFLIKKRKRTILAEEKTPRQKEAFHKQPAAIETLYKEINENGWFIDRSSYIPEKMTTAYNKIRLYDITEEESSKHGFPIQTPVRTIGILGNDENDDVVDRIEIYFHVPKEQADLMISSLFQNLHIVDLYMQNEYCRVPCSISYINVYDNKVTIQYWTLYGEDFKVEVFWEQGIWYCCEISGQKFDPPARINDSLVLQMTRKRYDGKEYWQNEVACGPKKDR